MKMNSSEARKKKGNNNAAYRITTDWNFLVLDLMFILGHGLHTTNSLSDKGIFSPQKALKSIPWKSYYQALTIQLIVYLMEKVPKCINSLSLHLLHKCNQQNKWMSSGNTARLICWWSRCFLDLRCHRLSKIWCLVLNSKASYCLPAWI
jgi:hypothetical protein